jgi:predicted ribosome quality control (RQC) complex YloA/Tae2 family protein
VPPTISDGERKRLCAEVRGLAGAPLQKLWLPSAQVCVLQFRDAVVVLDARSSMAAIASRRPTAPESAPRSQATLRNALASARLAGASLLEGRRARLDFSTPAGPRALITEQALLLIDAGSRRILWASAGAQRRPGAALPEMAEVPLGDAPPLERRDELVQGALIREEEAGVAARRRELVSRLRARVQKLKRTLAAVDEDAARASRADTDRTRAELLLPFASRVPRGAKEARVPDWSRTDSEGKPAEVPIALDPALSAAENAARWLKKAKRYQAAAARIATRRAQVAAELRAAEDLLARAPAAADAAALAQVETDAGPAAQPRLHERKAPRLPHRKFTSRSGAPILVGRSARDNDTLWKSARGNDLWLHVRGMQGAHVVVPGAGDPPDARTLADAALLAAHFSSARDSDAAEVAWTRCKYLRKPRDAPAGSVQVTQEKTLRVRHDAERLAGLLRSES